MAKPITPILVVDIIIEVEDGIVLIRRKNEPHGWALPGGCVDVGETTRQAAIREAQEETGLGIQCVRFLGVYDDPDRDPRGHAVSIAYACTAQGIPIGADDAAEAIVVSVDRILNPYSTCFGDLCFDHRQIIEDYAKQTN